MLISGGAARALDEVAARERDVLRAYTPGAAPERSDDAGPFAVQPTLDPLSAAPPPAAYFATQDKDGRMLFTQDGAFSLRAGALVDSQGRPVLGFARDGAPMAPLRADPVDEALGMVRDARIESDGSVTYDRTTTDPRSGRRESRRVAIGRLALARFAPGTKLQPVDAQHAAAPPGISPHVGRAGDGNFGALACFARESSGIDIDAGLERLQEACLALDAIRAAGQARFGLDKTTMDLLK